MDHHIKEFYRHSSDQTPSGNFHAVIALHEAQDMSWAEVSEKVPELSRGWYELSHLIPKDRIDFTHDFWLMKLPYREGLDISLDTFFNSLDDIGVYLSQKKFSDPFEVHLVYSLKGNGGFYRGALPMTEKKQAELQGVFPEYLLPADYLAFLQVHDGFNKATDCTGLTSSRDMHTSYLTLQEIIQQHDPMVTSKGTTVDPATLIPFYESFGMPFYQCFWGEWYPEQEMGNVYYSGEAKTISDIYRGVGPETMAFPTFTDWLMFYLERIS